MDAARYGGTKTQLALDDVRDVEIDVVGTSDENHIVPALSQRMAKLKTCAAKVATQMSLLSEHRHALITAAVTGVLDIPGVAA